MISGLVLAAGQSTRMSEPKLLMNWGETTVIGKVIKTLHQAGINDIIVITGRYQLELQQILKNYPLQFIFNPNYTNGEMLTSVQIGLKGVSKEAEAVLIVLGDQPQIETVVVQGIVNQFLKTHHSLIVPSYKMHRGHPWLVDNSYRDEILGLETPNTLRNFLLKHKDRIDYVEVDNPSILQDLDTPSDYNLYQP